MTRKAEFENLIRVATSNLHNIFNNRLARIHDKMPLEPNAKTAPFQRRLTFGYEISPKAIAKKVKYKDI